nr:MAG TPA: hypothetical protein [Caudoviricetes sp.]
MFQSLIFFFSLYIFFLIFDLNICHILNVEGF